MPPELGAEPGAQLGDRERFREVVVGPGVETEDAIVEGVARRDHDDGQGRATLAQPPADLGAGHARQHDVDGRGVEVLARRHREQGVEAVRDEPHVVTVAGQAAFDERTHLGVVLDEQDAGHVSVLRDGGANGKM